MSAQVAVAQVEGLLEKPEIGLICLVEHGEDPESNPLMDGVVEQLGRMRGAHLLAWILIPTITPARAALNDMARTG